MTRISTEERAGNVHAWGALASFVLLLLIGLLLIVGDRVGPRITGFNYADRLIEPARQQLRFTFSRPMDQASVEGGFSIEPSTDGGISWSGRTMVFTPSPEYIYLPRTKYVIRFDSGRDVYGKKLKPAELTFRVGDY